MSQQLVTEALWEINEKKPRIHFRDPQTELPWRSTAGTTYTLTSQTNTSLANGTSKGVLLFTIRPNEWLKH